MFCACYAVDLIYHALRLKSLLTLLKDFIKFYKNHLKT